MGAIVQRTLALVLAIATFSSVARPAAREDGPQIHSTATISIDLSTLRERLQLELVDTTDAPTTISLSGSEHRLTFTVQFRDGSHSFRTLDFDDVATEERENVLALAIAEAAHAHSALPPAPNGESRPEPEHVSPTKGPSELRWGYAAALGGRMFTARGTFGLEPRLGLWLRHQSGMRVDLSASYLWSTANDTLGRVTAQVAGGSLAIGYDRWTPNNDLAFHFGPRLDLGGTVGSATANAGVIAHSTADVHVGIAAEAGARLRATRAVAVAVEIDIGWIPRGLDLRAEGRPVLQTQGATLGLRLGISTP